MSDPFCVSSGVRQGGVLSPLLFAVYVDDLIAKLRCSGFGIHIGSLFYGCIFTLMILLCYHVAVTVCKNC